MTTDLQFQQVSYVYPSQSEYAVQQLSFRVEPGAFVGILGADGAGKTTIARLTNGLLLPTQGVVLVDDLPVRDDDSVYALRQKVGVIFADPENQIVGTTVEEDVAFGLGNLGLPSPEIRRRVDAYLERVGLAGYAKRAPHELSGGEQQKLCFAGVLAMEPQCLVLDEPLTFLDSRSRQELLSLLGELHHAGLTVLYLTSDPEELVEADRVVVIRQGTVVTECSISTVWNDLSILERAGIMPSDLMVFRDALKKQGIPIRQETLTPDGIVDDMLNVSKIT